MSIFIVNFLFLKVYSIKFVVRFYLKNKNICHHTACILLYIINFVKYIPIQFVMLEILLTILKWFLFWDILFVTNKKKMFTLLTTKIFLIFKG